ncbi:MAG: hypothetical protein GF315_00205 [candidate division Zixibacteria bacterium]|nr:hypothetical protein [candidate division Zixibacteria bacterium]
MNERYKELQEDVIDEKQAIEETLQKLNDVRLRYSSDSKDILVEPAMGTFLMNFYNGAP